VEVCTRFVSVNSDPLSGYSAQKWVCVDLLVESQPEVLAGTYYAILDWRACMYRLATKINIISAGSDGEII